MTEYDDLAEQCMSIPDFDLEKLKVALIFKKPGCAIPLTSSDPSLVLHGYTRDSEEDREGFASGNTTDDSAVIEVNCYWKVDGKNVVTRVVGSYTYYVTAHSGGVDSIASANTSYYVDGIEQEANRSADLMYIFTSQLAMTETEASRHGVTVPDCLVNAMQEAIDQLNLGWSINEEDTDDESE